MTKRKHTDEKYSALQKALYRLRVIALNLELDIPLLEESRIFLIDALNRIGRGEDANKVLGVVGKRGERRTLVQSSKSFYIKFYLSWIAAAIKPEEIGGLGYTLQKAIEEMASDFANEDDKEQRSPYTAETLMKYWNEYPEFRKPNVDRPIETLPDKSLTR